MSRSESVAEQGRAARESKLDRDAHNRSKGSNAAEREATLEGIRIGAKVRLREAAKEQIELAEAARAAGVEVSEAAEWGDSFRDDETGETRRHTLADAREILAEAERRAHKMGRGRGRWTVIDRERMTDRELMAVLTAATSATAAAINRKAARAARLSEEEYADLRGWLAVEAAEHGAPQWRAILTSEQAAEAARTLSGTDLATLRGRWVGYLILRGRQWRAERAERMAAEAEADPDTAEQAAEAEAERTAATVDAIASMLEAIGAPLGKAERVALLHALSGLSRREIAERFGHSADYVKTACARGRADLRKRWPTPAAARRALEAAATREAEAEAEPMAALAERIADAWRAMLRHDAEAAALAPRPPRRGRRILPLRPRVTDATPTRHGRPADVLAWIDRAPQVRANGASLRYARAAATADTEAAWTRRGFPRGYAERMRKSPVPAAPRAAAQRTPERIDYTATIAATAERRKRMAEANGYRLHRDRVEAA